MSKASGDYKRKILKELLADPSIQMVMQSDDATEQQLIESIGNALSKLGAGLSSKVGGAPKERATRDYRASIGVILLNRRNEVFIGRRRHYAPGEAWHMPQGPIDQGEEPRVAAFRELKKQIGTENAEVLAESKSWLFYDLPVGLTGRVRRKGSRGQRQKWFAMRFKGRDIDININAEKSEFCEWKWISISALPDFIASFSHLAYLSVLEEFLDAFGPYEDQT